MSTPAPTPANPGELVLPDGLNPELNPEAFTVAFIDQTDDVREFARDAADARLTTELNVEGGRFRKMVRGIWKGNIAREYYRQKYISEASSEIVEGDNLYANREDVDLAARTRARSATIAKFVGDYEGAIHADAGEKRKDITEAAESGEGSASYFASAAKNLIASYAEGSLTDESLVEARTRLLDDLRDRAEDQVFGEGVMIADNILEIAQNVKAAIEHGESIDRVMEKVRVISGESRSGVRTEAQYNRVDKVVDRINSSRAGSLVNEATIITAVSVAASLARFGSTKALNAAAMSVVPGVGAGLVAAARENKQIKDERRQHAREMATGQEYEHGNARRRDSMQETLYESVAAQSLIEDLAVSVDPENLDPADEAGLRTALDSILAAQSRIKLSDAQSIDLIGYSSVADVESERLILDISLARAKVTLRNTLVDASEDVQQSLGFNVNEDFDTNLINLSEGQVSVLEHDISQKDAAFNALRRREVAKTAAKAVVAGLAIGNGIQELKAIIDPKTQGLVEQAWGANNTPIDGRHHETLLHGVFAKNHGSTELHNHVLSGNTTNHNVGHDTKFAMSSEYKLQNVDGKFGIVDPQGKYLSEVAFDKSGALVPESANKLRELGLTVNDKSTTIINEVPHTRQGSIGEWLDHNRAGSTRVSRELWYDNNTPSPVFDKNELGLRWGGTNGLDEHGNYVFNTHAMTADGSFHGDQAAQWQQLASEGKLKMAFSANSETQHQVFMVDIDANGNAVIPKGSPVAEMFANQNGHAVFQGKYAEVVQTLGKDQGGTEHVRMLATHVGEDTLDNKPFNITELVPKSTTKHAYEIIGDSYTTTSELASFIEMAPMIPLYSRKGLENVLANEPTPYHYYNRELTPAEVEGRRARMSPRLRENPDADLSQAEEVNWYLGQQHTGHIDRIQRNLDSIPEPMGDDVEVVVTIPVAGHQESDNIYHTLEAYKNQTLDRDKYEIMLYVNHPITDKEGGRLNADATLAEIERFRSDNPDMPIRVMYEALPREDANIGYIRKVLVDSVLERNRQSSNAQELVIVSNDADAISIHEKYLEKMRNKTLADGVDATVGQIDWDNRAYVNYPEVHIGTRFFLMVDASLRIRDGRTGSNLGANAAFRASTYAAVGGYRQGVEIAEDVDLGLDMRAAREGIEGREVIAHGGVNGSRITTSARRAVHTWEEHADAPYHQWNYSFSADDDDVRAIQTGDLNPADFSDPERRVEIVQNVEHVVNKTLRSLHPVGLGSVSLPNTSISTAMTIAEEDRLVRHIERALHFMGIEFVWDGPGKIKITDGEKMLNGLHNYAIRAIRKDMLEEGVPTTGGFMMVNGQLRRANGQFMSKRERDAIMDNLPRLFGGAALTGVS